MDLIHIFIYLSRKCWRWFRAKARSSFGISLHVNGTGNAETGSDLSPGPFPAFPAHAFDMCVSMHGLLDDNEKIAVCVIAIMTYKI